MAAVCIAARFGSLVCVPVVRISFLLLSLSEVGWLPEEQHWGGCWTISFSVHPL